MRGVPRMEAPELRLEQNSRSGLALLTCALAVAAVMIAISVREVVAAGSAPLPGWAILALAMLLYSTRRIVPIPGSHSSVFLWEALACFGVILIGPYHGTLLAALGAGVAARRQKRATRELVASLAANTLSIYGAVQAHLFVKHYIAGRQLPAGAGGELLAFALPSIAFGLTYYVSRLAAVAALAARAGSFRDTFPWEPVTLAVSATVAAKY